MGGHTKHVRVLNPRKMQRFRHTKIFDFQGTIQNVGGMELRKYIAKKNRRSRTTSPASSERVI
jgi:hypothetical protein